MTLSKTWFGIVNNDNNMSATYRRLLDFKNTCYTIVGKLRDNDDNMVLIKFLLIFDHEIDFFDTTKERYADVFNTIIPIEETKVEEYIDLIKKITYIENGIDPKTKSLIDDERYYSSDDSAYTGSSDEEDDDDEEEEEEEEAEAKEEEEEQEEEEKDEITFVKASSCQPTMIFFWTVIGTLLFVNYFPLIVKETHYILGRLDEMYSNATRDFEEYNL